MAVRGLYLAGHGETGETVARQLGPRWQGRSIGRQGQGKTSKALAKTFHALTIEGTAELVRSRAAVSLVCALVCVAAPSLST